jgi:ferric-dicitrate binding protein FerR (iron transport regulator)
VTRKEYLDRERVNRLMMAALDGEVSADERRELTGILDANPEVRREYEMMSRVKEVTGTMTYKQPPEEVWDRYWTTVYNRVERGVAWILVSVGAVVVLTYGAWKWLEALWGDAGLPLFVKFAILTLAVGFLILAASVIREKLFAYRRDPYKEIER